MAIYINSKGEEVETSTMPLSYLERALAKAIREGNQDNVDILTTELNNRNTNQE